MASSSMFSATPNIKKAVNIVNNLDSTRFPLLLSRILQKLHLKDEPSFTEDEEGKLQGALGVDGPDLQLLIHTLEFFLQQAAYHGAKPTVLTAQLTEIEVEADKVAAITEAWAANGRSVIEKLRKGTISEKQLENVNWQLGLQVAQQGQTKMKEPVATFELTVGKNGLEDKEKIHLQFRHEELYKFYEQLETIQGQIDALS